MKQRNLSLDIIRIFACLLVITCHAPMARQDAHSFVHAATSLFSSPCNMLFFLVSGALLLPAPGTDLKLSTRDFLRKRLNKVLLPTLVWTVFLRHALCYVGRASLCIMLLHAALLQLSYFVFRGMDVCLWVHPCVAALASLAAYWLLSRFRLTRLMLGEKK